MVSEWHQTDKKKRDASLLFKPVRRTNSKSEQMPEGYVEKIRALRLEDCSKSFSIYNAGGTLELVKKWRQSSPELDAELKLFRTRGHNRTKTAATCHLEKL